MLLKTENLHSSQLQVYQASSGTGKTKGTIRQEMRNNLGEVGWK